MNFDDLYKELTENKENHDRGYYNCIPFTGMSRLEEYLPGIEQATYYLLTANSGIGKSKLARSLFIHGPYQFVLDNPNSDVKVSIKYFSLEESKRKVILSEISKYLFSKYGLIISIKQLQSIGRLNTVSIDVLNKIKEAKEYIIEFSKVIEIIDNIRNPTGIYKHVRDFALTIGTYYNKDGVALTTTEIENIRKGIGEDYKKVSYYKKHNPRHYVLILTDHLGLLDSEDKLTQHQTMSRYSSTYCLLMRDKFGFIPINVQQQASAKEQVEYNFKGKSIEEKLEPSLDGLGDNKLTQRDANIVLGLFSPERYSIPTHNGYDITVFKDMYRSMSILKDRDGIANKKLPLFFNGAIDFFKELPRPDDKENMLKVIDYINNIRKTSIVDTSYGYGYGDYSD